MKSRLLEILHSRNGGSYPQLRRQLRAGAYDEAEKPFTLAYSVVREPNDLGR